MLSKKLAIAAASAALMLGAFAPMAFADVSVNNHGSVEVDATTTANSGVNGVVANDEANVEGVTITSGAAVDSNTVGSEVNKNDVTVNGNEGDMPDVDVRNCGTVGVGSDVTANSGVNGVLAGDEANVEDATVTSGAATGASNVQSLVNVNTVTVNGNESDF